MSEDSAERKATTEYPAERASVHPDLLAAQRAVFTVAGGALALSITFRSSLVGDNPRGLFWLALAWLCLAACVAFYPVLRLRQSGLGLALDGLKTGGATPVTEAIPRERFWYRLCWRSYFVGIIGLALFALLNLLPRTEPSGNLWTLYLGLPL